MKWVIRMWCRLRGHGEWRYAESNGRAQIELTCLSCRERIVISPGQIIIEERWDDMIESRGEDR